MEMLEDASLFTFVYIAGPMTGHPNYNYDEFHAVESQLRRCGYVNINNPARHFDGDQGLSWETYISKAIDAILNSETIVVLPGWMDSIGAKLEIAIATAIGHVVYSAIEDTPGVYRYIKRDVGEPRKLVGALMGVNDHPLIPPAQLPNYPIAQLAHEEAANLVHGDRQDDYGHPLDNFSGTAGIWNGLLHKKLSHPITAEDVALCMVGIKLSRETHVSKRDNIVDSHGYLMTYEMVQRERMRRGQQT
jgi:hypothetical protein